MGSASAESIGVREPMFFQIKGRVTHSGRPALLVFQPSSLADRFPGIPTKAFDLAEAVNCLHALHLRH